MDHPALDERHDLADTLLAMGPAVPTLCDGWDAAELAAHLVLRERSLSEPAALLPLGPLQTWGGNARRRYVDRHPWPEVVAAVRQGPPLWSPLRAAPVRELANLLEYVVHHEDVRRGALGAAAVPRTLPTARDVAIWTALRRASRLLLARSPVAVDLEWLGAPAGPTSYRAHRGPTPVRVSGSPVELALVVFGRHAASRADWDGTPAAVAALRATPSPL